VLVLVPVPGAGLVHGLAHRLDDTPAIALAAHAEVGTVRNSRLLSAPGLSGSACPGAL